MLKLLRESLGRLGAAGEEDDSGDGPVQAVRNTEVDVAGLVIALLDVRLHLPLEGRDALRHALRQQPGRLGDGQTVVVFVEDFD